MVLGLKPVCTKCSVEESLIWSKYEGNVLCSDCYAVAVKADRETESSKEDQNMQSEDTQEKSTDGRKEEDECKSSDKKEYKRRTRKGKGGKGNIPKGKGRRYIFKKSATRGPVAVATPVTSDYLFYKDMYYQVGDIVSLIDIDGGTFYAQIRGLLQDQYCEKSAVLSWLIPTKKSPPPEVSFDPSTYIIGPEEDIPRKLESMEFVCHAPSDYFKDRTSPYTTANQKPESCFVWSRIGPQIKPIEKVKELMMK